MTEVELTRPLPFYDGAGQVLHHAGEFPCCQPINLTGESVTLLLEGVSEITAVAFYNPSEGRICYFKASDLSEALKLRETDN